MERDGDGVVERSIKVGREDGVEQKAEQERHCSNIYLISNFCTCPLQGTSHRYHCVLRRLSFSKWHAARCARIFDDDVMQVYV